MARMNESPISWLRRLSGTFEKIIEAVEEQGGTFDNIKSFISDPENRRNLGLLVMGKLKPSLPCQRNVPHLIPHWVTKVINDVERHEFDSKKLKFPSFLRDEDGGRIDWKTLQKRAKEMGADFGLSDLPALLGPDGNGLKTIPAELRDKDIILPGTIMLDSKGDLYCLKLYWNGRRWVLSYPRLDRDWIDTGRLVSYENTDTDLPTELTVCHRTYDILFPQEGKNWVFRHEMVKWAVEMRANLGRDDAEYLMDYQHDIPVSLRKIWFIFTGLRLDNYSGHVYCVRWHNSHWEWCWIRLSLIRDSNNFRVLRPKVLRPK